MKKYLLFKFAFALVLGLSMFSSNSVRASHAAGAELIYDHVSDSTYVFIYKFYRDCSGISAPNSIPLCGKNTCGINNVSGTLLPIAVIPGGGVNGTPVDPGCPGYATNCTGGNLPGFEEWWYVDTITIPGQCNQWTFYCGISARNGPFAAVPVLNLANGGNLYTETTFNNTISHVNSSPRFLNKPVPYVCINQAFTFNHNGFDPDGDSLVYFNVNPKDGPTGCSGVAPTNIGYAAGYSLANPIATSTTGPFSFNPFTGALSFTPNLAGAYALATKVEEYRNGLYLGSIIRDVQIIVLSNCININPGTVINPPIGGTLVSGYVRGCPNQLLDFCFDIYSPDTAVKFSATSTAGTVIPTSTVTFTGIGTDSLVGCFSWTPTSADIGIHTFTVTAKDTSCRPPGIVNSSTFSYSILIPAPVDGVGDTALCSLDSAKLYAVQQLGDSMVWAVVAGDYGSLSCTSCDTVYATPNVTTTYVVTDVNSICDENKDTVVVSVLPPPLVDIGYDDTVICQNSSVTFNPIVSPAGAYNFTWTPNYRISSTNVLTPTVDPLVSTMYYLTVQEQNAGCSSMDSVFVEVIPLDMAIVDKAPGICKGDVVNLQMSGSAPDSFTYAWSPSIFLNDSTLMNPTSTTDTSIVYTVTISRPGCMSYNDAAVVTVEPVPTVDLGVDRVLCQWDTVNLNPTIDPSWYNGYSYSWSNTTNLAPTNVPNPVIVGNTTGQLTYILTVSTPLGCSGTDDITVTVNPGNFMTVNPESAFVCPRDSVLLSAVDAQSVVWEPSQFLDDPTSLTPTSKPLNSINYIVYGTSVEGCKDTGYVSVQIAPEGVLEMGDDITVYEGDQVQLLAQGNCSYFRFTPATYLDDPTISNPMVSGLNTTTTYYVEGSTVYGCLAKDTIKVIFDTSMVVTLPNAFTPNGTEGNSVISIIKRGPFNLNYFRIFNRWGEKVFETGNIEEGWDGRYNGHLQPIGTYVWEIQGVDRFNNTISKTGNFILIK